MILRINEAYVHEPILPYQGEENCSPNNCGRICTQCVDVSEPLLLRPNVTVGTATVTCQGTPTITCVTSPDGSTTTITLTQQVCVSVPVQYGVSLTEGEATIACADNCIGCGCC